MDPARDPRERRRLRFGEVELGVGDEPDEDEPPVDEDALTDALLDPAWTRISEACPWP